MFLRNTYLLLLTISLSSPPKQSFAHFLLPRTPSETPPLPLSRTLVLSLSLSCTDRTRRCARDFRRSRLSTRRRSSAAAPTQHTQAPHLLSLVGGVWVGVRERRATAGPYGTDPGCTSNAIYVIRRDHLATRWKERNRGTHNGGRTRPSAACGMAHSVHTALNLRPVQEQETQTDNVNCFPPHITARHPSTKHLASPPPLTPCPGLHSFPHLSRTPFRHRPWPPCSRSRTPRRTGR
jgi:hypothetical protein